MPPQATHGPSAGGSRHLRCLAAHVAIPKIQNHRTSEPKTKTFVSCTVSLFFTRLSYVNMVAPGGPLLPPSSPPPVESAAARRTSSCFFAYLCVRVAVVGWVCP